MFPPANMKAKRAGDVYSLDQFLPNDATAYDELEIEALTYFRHNDSVEKLLGNGTSF